MNAEGGIQISITSRLNAPTGLAATEGGGRSLQPPQPLDRQLIRWGGVAGLTGVILLLGSAVVVVGLGMPEADDVETLTDFANIESGRIAEHFLYLGALVCSPFTFSSCTGC